MMTFTSRETIVDPFPPHFVPKNLFRQMGDRTGEKEKSTIPHTIVFTDIIAFIAAGIAIFIPVKQSTLLDVPLLFPSKPIFGRIYQILR